MSPIGLAFQWFAYMRALEKYHAKVILARYEYLGAVRRMPLPLARYAR